MVVVLISPIINRLIIVRKVCVNVYHMLQNIFVICQCQLS